MTIRSFDDREGTFVSKPISRGLLLMLDPIGQYGEYDSVQCFCSLTLCAFVIQSYVCSCLVNPLKAKVQIQYCSTNPT